MISEAQRPLSYAKLLEEWSDLLARRPLFREPLTPYRPVLEAWARWPAERVAPLGWTQLECEERWRRGVPLISDASPPILREDIEDLLSVVLDFLAVIGEPEETLKRFAGAWDRGEVGLDALLPARGRVGLASLTEDLGLRAESVSFLVCGALRPALDRYFAGCRVHFTEGSWDLGVCPYCGAPPGFGDLIETGQRRLACHVCGGGWVFPRLRCPFCGTQSSSDLVRLEAEDREEGYFISACRQCKAYVKELDRRLRWNAGSALIEDWGSPHFDLVAVREGYWRPIASLVHLARHA
jgi:FdhE protein